MQEQAKKKVRTIGKQRQQHGGGAMLNIDFSNYHVLVAMAKARNTTIKEVANEIIESFILGKLAQ